MLSVRKVVEPEVEGNDELVGSNTEKRNWTGMAIALLVIATVCGFVALAVLVMSEDTDYNLVRLEDIVRESWKSQVAADARWISGDKLVWKDNLNNIHMADGASRERSTIIVNNYTYNQYGVQRYQISPDGKFALFACKLNPVYSRSFNASYTIYNMRYKSEAKLRLGNRLNFQFAGFGSRGNQLIFVSDGDIYYMASVHSQPIRMTESADPLVRNGISDWLYEEEILMSPKAHWWSPDGRHLAHAQFDDRAVEQTYVTSYSGRYDVGSRRGADSNPVNLVYPRRDVYSCPKAGYSNPVVIVMVRDLATNSTLNVRPPISPASELMDILQSVTWMQNSRHILVTWSNRAQMNVVVQVCDVVTSSCGNPVAEASSNHERGWIPNLNVPPSITNETGLFFWISPRQYHSQGNFNHIQMINFTARPPKRKFITDGAWEVTKLLRYDPTTRHLYFISNEEAAGQRHVYRQTIAPVASNNASCTRDCLTCSTTLFTPSCLYFDADISPDGDLVLVHCLGPNVPKSYLSPMRALVAEFDDEQESNSETSPANLTRPVQMFASHMERFNCAHALYFYRHGTIHKDGYDINFRITTPVKYHAKRPVIFEVGDVGSQHVDSRFSYGFGEYLTAEDSIIHVRVDGRGSGFRGQKLLTAVHGDPGLTVVEDLLDVLEYMQSELHLVVSGVAILGKGFGGFVSVFALTSESRFSCAVAVAPIVDWTLHTSTASEKLLGSLERDIRNYERCNLLHGVRSLSGKRLLLQHGLKDRVVHHQHSVLLRERAMGALNISPLSSVVRSEMYADQDHAETDARVAYDMRTDARRFLHRCFFDKSPQPLRYPRL